MNRMEAFEEINEIQDNYINELISLINDTSYDMMKMINFTSPTGTGKTNMMAKFINKFPNYYFIITTLSKGQLHIQVREKLIELTNQQNFYVYGSSDYKINSKLDANDIISKIPKNTKCIWLRDEGHIRTNRWDELLEQVCYKIVNFSATNTHSDIQCNFTSTMMLRTVNQTNGTPEDAINKLIEVKKAHRTVLNYNPCAIFRIVSGDEDLYNTVIDLCVANNLSYIDITNDEYVMREICEDNNKYDVIINKFKIVEGIDIRRAHVLYMDNQPGNNATTIQVIGRCRRNALLYRNDIDILDIKNKDLLIATRECYVFYNVEKMRIDEDTNGELQYAFCNHISCQALKPNTTIEVIDGQLNNGLYIIELCNCSGKYKIELDEDTGYNIIQPLTDFYNLEIQQKNAYVYARKSKKILNEDIEIYVKAKKELIKPFMLTNSYHIFDYETGDYKEITLKPTERYYNFSSFTSEFEGHICISEEEKKYFVYRKMDFLKNLPTLIKYIENVSINPTQNIKLNSIDFECYKSIINKIISSKLDVSIKQEYIDRIYQWYIDDSTTLYPKYHYYTDTNIIYVESVINELLLYDDINLVLSYVAICPIMILIGYTAMKTTITDIIQRVPHINERLKAQTLYDGTIDTYYEPYITKNDIDIFFNNIIQTICRKYYSKQNTKNILNYITNYIQTIEDKLNTNLATIVVNFESIFNEGCSLEEISILSKYLGKTINIKETDISSYNTYYIQYNDFESSLVGTDLMRQIRDNDIGVTWIESKAVSSKIGNYNKLNKFITNRYKDEISMASKYYTKGKNDFKFDKKCNSVVGYCVEYYSKYLVYGIDYLKKFIIKAIEESKLHYEERLKYEKNLTLVPDPLIIRACMLKYKEMMVLTFGNGVEKIIKTISIDKLIQHQYQDFIITVKTLGMRVADFVKKELYNNQNATNNINPNLSIKHISGLADYITEDTILDVKVNGNINEQQVKQVLTYHYLSTKRSDINIKRVIVFDATSGNSVIIHITSKNLKENCKYGYKSINNITKTIKSKQDIIHEIQGAYIYNTSMLSNFVTSYYSYFNDVDILFTLLIKIKNEYIYSSKYIKLLLAQILTLNCNDSILNILINEFLYYIIDLVNKSILNGNISPYLLNVLQKLITNNHKITSLSQCSAIVLEKLANINYDIIKYDILDNPNITNELLQKMSNDSAYKVRMLVASHKNCSLDVLEKLSMDESNYVRASVASNENCPITILNTLSEDKYINVKIAVLKNNNCTKDIFEKLKSSDSKKIQKIINTFTIS